MIAQSTYKAVRYNGRPVADDLVSCYRNYSLGPARLQFTVWSNAVKHILVGINLLEGLRVAS